MARYVIEVMYDGTRFSGSQVQGDQPTVQLELTKALSLLFRRPVPTLGASRTDEGVHALCNYYHFDADEFTFDLIYKMNAILPPGVAVKKLHRVPDDFNARFHALTRRYRYRIYAAKNPFLQDRAYHFPFRLNHDMLNETAAIIRQHTHFEAFAKRNSQSHTFTCIISQSYWEQIGLELHYVVEANRFLRGMVRGLVGTQLYIARGKGTPKDFIQIMESNNCTNAFFDVPGHGLYLEEIRYKEGILT